ncbi:hypothetical protein QBC47DRAFT_398915 [Echria macrotheca]|uniref:Uncharacterized protein n=1 Tax=Echria macrotheca TaxID=438768 RepID=A0AAJ0BHE8_9PEZI|nr:hypothetical protein QBC47DRAFT_398915 [Echria macrotheca]
MPLWQGYDSQGPHVAQRRGYPDRGFAYHDYGHRGHVYIDRNQTGYAYQNQTFQGQQPMHHSEGGFYQGWYREPRHVPVVKSGEGHTYPWEDIQQHAQDQVDQQGVYSPNYHPFFHPSGGYIQPYHGQVQPAYINNPPYGPFPQHSLNDNVYHPGYPQPQQYHLPAPMYHPIQQHPGIYQNYMYWNTPGQYIIHPTHTHQIRTDYLRPTPKVEIVTDDQRTPETHTPTTTTQPQNHVKADHHPVTNKTTTTTTTAKEEKKENQKKKEEALRAQIDRTNNTILDLNAELHALEAVVDFHASHIRLIKERISELEGQRGGFVSLLSRCLASYSSSSSSGSSSSSDEDGEGGGAGLGEGVGVGEKGKTDWTKETGRIPAGLKQVWRSRVGSSCEDG